MTTPRRRADDWKTDSGVAFPRRSFYALATELGYDPRDVVSIRMNENEVNVVLADYRGMTCVRHGLTNEEGPA